MFGDFGTAPITRPACVRNIREVARSSLARGVNRGVPRFLAVCERLSSRDADDDSPGTELVGRRSKGAAGGEEFAESKGLVRVIVGDGIEAFMRSSRARHFAGSIRMGVRLPPRGWLADGETVHAGDH